MALLVLFSVVSPGARAAPAPAGPKVPAELSPWVDWALAGQPDLACARDGEQARCLWQGVLSIDLREGGADFTLQVVLDRSGAVPLPGGAGAWPANVKLRGAATPVLAVGDVPTVQLGRGFHVLEGSLRWSRAPSTLRVPPAVGVLRLSRGGKRLPVPTVASDGTIRLGAEGAAGLEDATLGIDVSRRIVDDVPVLVVTHIALRASGEAREVDLGHVLLAGATAVQLDADLPARLDEEGRLSVQVRPGSFFVEIRSIQDGPVLALSAPTSATSGWPEREFWVLEPDEGVRAVEVSGAPGIDPQRASLPAGWQGLATWMMAPGATLTFKELRRGQPVVPPNLVDVQRRLWLDPDGGGWTVADRLTGVMSQGWRLEAAEPLVLGSVRVDNQPQVITTGETAGGFEVRGVALSIEAESRIDGAQGAFPAVGWATEARDLSVQVMLPPGWRLLTAVGPDQVYGSWLLSWSLIDLLVVFLAVGLVARTEGLRWAPIAAIALTSGPPGVGLALLLLVLGGLRFAESQLSPEQAAGRGAAMLRRVVAGAALLAVVWTAAGALQDAALPSTQVRARVDGSGWLSGGQAGQMSGELRDIPDRFSEIVVDAAPSSASVYRQSKSVKSSAYDNFTLQLDPGAAVQTGPGLPTWHGSTGAATANLRWEGAVSPTQELRLITLSPWMVLIQALLHALALVAVVARQARVREEGWLRAARVPTGAAAALLLAVALGVPRVAQAAPDAAMLRELEARLSAPPPCRPNCVAIGALDFKVGPADGAPGAAERGLSLSLEVHAGEDVSVPLPGPAAIWAPDRVLVDNVPTAALAREADGFIHVRVPEGVHRVVATGPLPERGPLTLQVGLPPQRATMSGDGWALRGLRADGGVERSVQLVREADGEERAERSADNLAPWILVRRFLDLGVPWRVRTTVSRVGPSRAPLALRVPLIEGEAVTVDGLQVQDGAVLVSLDQDVSNVEWTGTLVQREQLVLSAPAGVPWTEEWALSCSPIFHCEVADGAPNAVPAPFVHVFEGRWTPQWRPWPGESLHLLVSRPPGAPGRTLTIESAALDIDWRGRQRDATLRLSIASSQGGQHRVRLPAGATLRSVDLGGAPSSLELTDGWLSLPLKPGHQAVSISWRNEGGAGFFVGSPDLDLGAPVSNLQITHSGLEDRWMLGASGSGWGPHMMTLPMLLVWGCVAVAFRQALVLRRLWAWPWGPAALVGLCLGLVGQVPMPVVLAMIGVIAAQGAVVERKERRATTQLLSLLALGAGPVLLLLLGFAAYQGVAVGAANSVVGNGSTAGALTWTTYRAPSTLMPAVVISTPGWVGRVLYLAWNAYLLRLAPAALRRWWANVVEGLLRLGPPSSPPGGGGEHLWPPKAPEPSEGRPRAVAPVRAADGAASRADGDAAVGFQPAAGGLPVVAAGDVPHERVDPDEHTDPGWGGAAPMPGEVAPAPAAAEPPIAAGASAHPVSAASTAPAPVLPDPADPARAWPYPSVSPVVPPTLPEPPPHPEASVEDEGDPDSELAELPSLPGTAAKIRMGDRPLPPPRRPSVDDTPEIEPSPAPTEDDEISALLGGLAEDGAAIGEE